MLARLSRAIQVNGVFGLLKGFHPIGETATAAIHRQYDDAFASDAPFCERTSIQCSCRPVHYVGGLIAAPAIPGRGMDVPNVEVADAFDIDLLRGQSQRGTLRVPHHAAPRGDSTGDFWLRSEVSLMLDSHTL